jgi:hypothetical protein
VRQFQDFQEDWDGEGASVLDSDTIENAEGVVELVLSQSLSRLIVPTIVVGPLHDGSVRFEWTHSDKELFLTVRGHEIEVQRWQPLAAISSEGYWKTDLTGVKIHTAWLLD